MVQATARLYRSISDLDLEPILMKKLGLSGLVLLSCLGLSVVPGCGSGSEPVMPKAENPNPDLQPAGRSGPDGADSTGSGRAAALGEGRN